jgi:uncharacterized protein with PIN domain
MSRRFARVAAATGGSVGPPALRCYTPLMLVSLRVYGELNDFLHAADRHRTVVLPVECGATVKDFIESHGVPHTEIDLLLVNGESVDFRSPLGAGDRVAAYPVFEAFDIAGVSRVRPEPLRVTRFVLDVHLGRLARYLRLAGFDALYDRASGDNHLVEVSKAEHRVILTRDRGLLKRRAVTHGYFVRSTIPARQLAEVVSRFDLQRLVRPFSRCTMCNGLLVSADKSEVEAEVPERSRQRFAQFLRCPSCRRVYWQGAHYPRLEQMLSAALDRGRQEAADAGHG